MIGVAGYLNYTDNTQGSFEWPAAFTQNSDGTINALIADTDLIETAQVDGIEIATLPPISELDLPESSFVNSIDISNEAFFVQARINREQARASQREILLELINNENTDSEIRAEAAADMLNIQRRIEREASAEALIESRGFNEVHVRIGDGYVDVIVNKADLTESELAQIEDVIRRKVGAETGTIRISPMRQANS